MLRVAITSSYSAWGAWSPHDLFDPESPRMIAGGETAMLWLAFGLAVAGWEVTLFYDTDKPQTYRGVDFLPASYTPDLICNRHCDVLISWENLQPPSMNHTADLVVVPFQTNATAVGALDYSVDYYQAVSQWHINTLAASDPSFRPESRSKFVVFPNGVDLDRYQQPSPERHPFRIIHSSSPDRGLHHLLRMWPDIRKAAPEAELHIFYEIKRWLDLEASFPGISTGERAREVRRRLAETEGQGVIVRGPVNQWRLAQEQMAASLLVYTMDSIDAATEGFGITILEGLAAGTPVITTDGDAFGELWPEVTRQLPLPVENKEDSWVRAIHYLLTDKDEWQRYSDNGRKHAEQYSWRRIGQKYAVWLEGALLQKRGESASKGAYDGADDGSVEAAL